MLHSDRGERVYSLLIKFGFAEHTRDIRTALLESRVFQRILRDDGSGASEDPSVAFFIAKSRLRVDAARPFYHRAVSWFFWLLSDLQVNTADFLQLPSDATMEISSSLPI